METTRHFLLEWLSYAHRYIPVGLLDVIPQKLNWRPPNYFGRNDLETLMASDSAADWVSFAFFENLLIVFELPNRLFVRVGFLIGRMTPCEWARAVLITTYEISSVKEVSYHI